MTKTKMIVVTKVLVLCAIALTKVLQISFFFLV